MIDYYSAICLHPCLTLIDHIALVFKPYEEYEYGVWKEISSLVRYDTITGLYSLQTRIPAFRRVRYSYRLYITDLVGDINCFNVSFQDASSNPWKLRENRWMFVSCPCILADGYLKHLRYKVFLEYEAPAYYCRFKLSDTTWADLAYINTQPSRQAGRAARMPIHRGRSYHSTAPSNLQFTEYRDDVEAHFRLCDFYRSRLYVLTDDERP